MTQAGFHPGSPDPQCPENSQSSGQVEALGDCLHHQPPRVNGSPNPRPALKFDPVASSSQWSQGLAGNPGPPQAGTVRAGKPCGTCWGRGGAYLRRLAQVLGQDNEVDQCLRVAAVLATEGMGRVSFSRPQPQLRAAATRRSVLGDWMLGQVAASERSLLPPHTSCFPQGLGAS